MVKTSLMSSLKYFEDLGASQGTSRGSPIKEGLGSKERVGCLEKVSSK